MTVTVKACRNFEQLHKVTTVITHNNVHSHLMFPVDLDNLNQDPHNTGVLCYTPYNDFDNNQGTRLNFLSWKKVKSKEFFVGLTEGRSFDESVQLCQIQCKLIKEGVCTRITVY